MKYERKVWVVEEQHGVNWVPAGAFITREEARKVASEYRRAQHYFSSRFPLRIRYYVPIHDQW